jgi:hypothetical protein
LLFSCSCLVLFIPILCCLFPPCIVGSHVVVVVLLFLPCIIVFLLLPCIVHSCFVLFILTLHYCFPRCCCSIILALHCYFPAPALYCSLLLCLTRSHLALLLPPCIVHYHLTLLFLPCVTTTYSHLALLLLALVVMTHFGLLLLAVAHPMLLMFAFALCCYYSPWVTIVHLVLPVAHLRHVLLFALSC